MWTNIISTGKTAIWRGLVPAVLAAYLVSAAAAQYEREPRRLSPASLAQPRAIQPYEQANRTSAPAASTYVPAARAEPANHQPALPAGPTLSLPKPGEVSSTNHASSSSSPRNSALPSTGALLGGLAVVVGLFLSTAWLVKKFSPRSRAALPREAFEVLGRAPLGGRQFVHLIRVGGKLLLVSVSPAGCETLTEIADPAEVEHLASVCGHPTVDFNQHLQQAATARARTTLDMFERPAAPPNFLDLPREDARG